MAARRGQKVKLLHIIEILKKYTDEEHPLSATQICEKLESVGVTAERKAIYDDIECLIGFGYDIVQTRTPKSGYFMGARDFELPEIYLLGDAVRTARFISAKKTRELINKLEGMLSSYQQREKGIYIDSSNKTRNEEIFYNIDAIGRAIENRKKITFKYGMRSLSDNRELETTYKMRTISPYAMTWQDDHYYLIGNYDKYDNLAHFRIDRMRAVSETAEPARPYSEVCEYKDAFDVADYTKKLFGMFVGEVSAIELRCSKKILEQVADRFGENVFIKNVTQTHFDFGTDAVISEALVTWLTNYGSDIEVLSPQNLRDMMKTRAENILKLYGG